MPWFKVDDTLTFHTKVMDAGNAAMGLWTRAGAWSMQQLTDGYIPKTIAYQIGTKSQCQRLVDAGLWMQKDDGYMFHEWGQRQPSRARLEADREANAERLRKWRDKKKDETDE